MKRILPAMAAVGVLSMAACGGDDPATAAGSGQGGDTSSSGGSGPASGTGGAGAGTGASSGGTGASGGGSTSSGSGGSPQVVNLCNEPAPGGATEAADPPAYSGGSCPALVQGHNAGFMSGGVARDFIVLSPSNPAPGETFPVIFFWHWLGGSADDFLETGDLAAAVEQQRFIAAIPESIGAEIFGNFDVKWPFDVSQTEDRMNQEFAFFDDMLSCVSEQFAVNKNCVASAGVSAGALFTDQLAAARSEFLSSFISLSGGTGGNLIRPWAGASHKLPALVLWGGPTDACFSVLNFEECSKDLEQSLTAEGHYFVECVHNCGHGPPPVEVAPGVSAFGPLWDFVFAHPFWLSEGDSPWSGGLPDSFITWCGVGDGSAVPRTGECPSPPGC